MDTLEHEIYHVWIHFIPSSLYPRREKTTWSELKLNPSPLASQATALTARPWLLGQMDGATVEPYPFLGLKVAILCMDAGHEGIIANRPV